MKETPSKEWQRATKPAQKALRRDAILDAAKRLFAQKSYEEVSLNGIAREAGMSKPNVYRYFSSREEIFLQIFAEERDRFFDAIFEGLESLDRERPVEELTRVWVEQGLKHEALMTLLPQLGSSLEKNSSVEQLVPFKKTGFARMAELAAKHQEIYPRLDLQRWGEVISATVALSSGLWPLCHGGEAVEEAMRHPEVNLEPWDYSEKMTFALSALIRGSAP